MVRVRGVIFSLVMSWMPDTTMEENIMTAAPPRTAWGMMEMSAPSLGMRPQSIRKMAPVASAPRLTTLVMATRPTFWLKEVLGRTPKQAATVEPRPSQMMPPLSSLSVASRPMPPSMTPEMSPTVSTAVTMNMIMTGRMARRSKTILTGTSFGMANQLASATLFQFSTHALVNSTPSAVTPVVGRTKPMTMAAR